MRILRFALVCGLSVGCGQDDAATSTDASATRFSFRLLTYNVAGLPEGLSSSSPARNTPLISPLLNAYDVVLLQEDFAFQREIASAVTHPHRSAPDPSARALGDGLTVFSVVPFQNFTREPWRSCYGTVDSGSDCLTPKGFVHLQLTLSEGITIDLYDLHADAGYGEGDLTARADNFAQLESVLSERSRDHAVIIAGDMNTRYRHPTDQLAAFVQRTQLSDAWIELLNMGTTPTPDSPAPCPPEAPDHPSCERIDKVLYKSGASVALRPIAYSVEDMRFVDHAGAPLSDHRPVAVTFEAASTR